MRKKIIVFLLVLLTIVVGSVMYIIFRPSPEVRDCIEYGGLDKESCQQYVESEKR